jgi:hypothetical protein
MYRKEIKFYFSYKFYINLKYNPIFMNSVFSYLSYSFVRIASAISQR